MRYFKIAAVLAVSVLSCNSEVFSTDIMPEELPINKKPIVTTSFVELVENSSIEDFPDNLKYSLINLTRRYNSDAFGTKEAQAQSTRNWLQKCKTLKLASSLGSEEAKQLYEEALESKKYSRDYCDCLLAGYEDEYDVRAIRAFFWEHLSYEDEEEREALIRAYREGKEVPKNLQKADFWKSYKNK